VISKNRGCEYLTFSGKTNFNPLLNMNQQQNITTFRVRYSETDPMGTFYNSRALEWFECGRSEWLRANGLPYTEIEARGVFLPLVESHVRYLGRARYDDQLELTTKAFMDGKVCIRFEASIVHADHGVAVAEGYTIHVCTDHEGKPIRPPVWLTSVLQNQVES
jgi:acyl-CoA thioester hydrolase